MSISKASVSLRGHRTSFSLEPEFMALLKAVAKDRRLSLAELVAQIDEEREGNLSSALRMLVLTEVGRLAAERSETQGDGSTSALEASLRAWLSENQGS